MRVFAQNADGSRELLFEVDEDAVRDRHAREEFEAEQAVLRRHLGEERVAELASDPIDRAHALIFCEMVDHMEGEGAFA